MGWLAVALGLVGGVLTAQPASACTRVLALEMGQPADGAVDVPTNVVPWLWGHVADGTVTVTLHAWAGTEVPVEVEPLAGYVVADMFRVRPVAPLEPDTRYELTVDVGGEPRVYGFTTGEGPLDEMPPALGELRMQIANNAYMSSCGNSSYACVALPPGSAVLATVTTSAGGTEAELLWQWPEALRYVRTPSSTDSPFCIELRARNLAGTLGPPSIACSEDAPTFEVATTSPVTCEGGRVLTGDGPADGLPPPSMQDDAGPARAPDAGPAKARGGADGGCRVAQARGAPTWSWSIVPLVAAVRRRARRTRSAS